MESEQRRRDLSQFFTPPDLARKLWRWAVAPATRPLRILEPSAGNGALIRPLRELAIPVQSLVAYEVDPMHCATLAELVNRDQLPAEIRQEDFLAASDPGSFDISVLNTPYEDGQEIAFAERVLQCSTRLCGVFRAAIIYGDERYEFWRWTDITRFKALSNRPHFGGDDSAKSDFVLMELRRRRAPRPDGEDITVSFGWWRR